MKGTIYKTPEEVLRRAQEAIGLLLSQIDHTGRLKTGKGAIGTVIEESWFGYSPNNESEPDFPEAGIELKVTPYIRNSKGIRAKERLVCNIINYMTEYKKDFENSDFWHKCKRMLIMSYEYRPELTKANYQIDQAILFSFPTEDLYIIKQDWNKIIAKIRSGQAHLITEGDTLYLAACAKGATAQTVREQPFSPIPAKQRAYSLKSSYMTRILNDFVFGNKTDEHIVKNPNELANHTFEEYIINKIKPYYGFTQEQLKNKFEIHSNPKNLNAILLAQILGIKGSVSHSSEFQKAHIVLKTIRINKNDKIIENMSLPQFKFMEIIQEDWEHSTLRNYLEPTKFLFVVFKESPQGQYILSDIKFWNMPTTDLNEVKKVWEQTVRTIKEGIKTEIRGNKVYNNLPKSSDNPVAHVRPHAQNTSDIDLLPDGRKFPKQSFWLNNKYIAHIIQNKDY